MIIPEKKMCFVLVAIFILTVVPMPETHGSVCRMEQNTRSGKTFVVNASGGGDYTRIQWAVENASDGDRVIVEEGEYRENIKINRSIELTSPCWENATINATGVSSGVNITSDDVTVKGFHIINSEKNTSGIRLEDSRHCMIERNNISGNGIGISFFNSSRNRVANNTISRSEYYGVWIDYNSSGNSIYLNNFIDNQKGNVTRHFQAYDDFARNDWNNEAGMGNYWSDYETGHPNASNDGVKWDEPYFMDANSLCSGIACDFFPLCEPVETSNPYPIAEAGPDITIRERRAAVLNANDSWGYVPLVNYTWSFTYDNGTYSLYGAVQSFRFDVPGIYEISLAVTDSSGRTAFDSLTITVLNRSRDLVVVDATGMGDFLRIGDGIEDVNDGGTVLVRKGVYRERLIIKRSVNLVGDGWQNTTIDGGMRGDAVRIEADRVNISGFNITNASDDAIEIRHSNHSRIESNNFVDNNWGLLINNSCHSVITDNTLVGNGIYFNGSLLEHWASHNIDDTNLVNGRPICYWKNIRASGERVPQGVGQIIIANCSGIVVEGHSINNTDTALAVGFSNNNTICRNNLSFNENGIYINNVSNNTINNNICRLNNRTGIIASKSSNSIISNNSCLDNGEFEIDIEDSINNIIRGNECNSKNIEIVNNNCTNNSGICMSDSNDNLIEKNICENNKWGIVIVRCSNNRISSNTCRTNVMDGLGIAGSSTNTISNNTFEKNQNCGVGFYSICDHIHVGCDGNTLNNNKFISNINYSISLDGGSFNTTIFHNDFIDNNVGGQQAYDYGERNHWNTTNSGNYWSDHTYPDYDGDGIVDRRYEIDGKANSYDYFPLTEPYEPPPPVADAGPDITVDENTTVQFNATNSSDEACIVNYTWEFDYEGDKVELYGPTPNYTFEEQGTYNIKLTVTDQEGNVGFDNVLVTINPIVPEDDDSDDNATGEEISRNSEILMWLGVTCLVFIVILVGMLMVKNRGKKDDSL